MSEFEHGEFVGYRNAEGIAQAAWEKEGDADFILWMLEQKRPPVPPPRTDDDRAKDALLEQAIHLIRTDHGPDDCDSDCPALSILSRAAELGVKGEWEHGKA